MSETPILVGICELEQRIDNPLSGAEPIELMIDAVRQAAVDAGCPKLLGKVSSIRVIRGRWPYKNPAAAVAEAIGVPSAESCLTPYGGNFVQSTVNQSALDIQAGHHEVIIITGDHSTPTALKEHSWHHVPALMASPWPRPTGREFGESACRAGDLGVIHATDLLPLALAHTGRLVKYGA